MFLRNAWYVAMWGPDLAEGALERRRILGEPIVFFRKEDGGLGALADVCPHRFAAFSVLGRLLPGDRIQCPYHGLQFGVDGKCVHNPHGPGNLPEAATVKTYPVVERHSLVWIWMGEPARADLAAIPDMSLLDRADSAHATTRDWLVLDASYILITENLLDLSHANILHDGILGNEESIPAEIVVEQDGDKLSVMRLNENVPVPGMYDLMYRRDGGRVDMWTEMSWQAPGCMINDTGVTEVGGSRGDGSGIFGTHFLTPETETTTLYHFCAIRRNPVVLDAADAAHVRQRISELRRKAFEQQDGLVIATQQKQMLDPAINSAHPVLLKIDEAPVRFRRILDGLIAAEQERPPV